MRFLYPHCASLFLLLATVVLSCTRPAGAAPTVRLGTVVGDIDIELLHEDAPSTVTNFLNYVVTDRYDESFFHRSVPGFVVQGGGYTFPAGGEIVENVPADPPVINEPGVSNTRGTVAMAKIGGDPNSATSQFYFNLGDNSDLDDTNGGFTVFGHVVDDGMSVVDQIAGLQTVDAGAPFDNLPVRDLQGNTVTRENLILVNDAQVLSTSTAGDYNANGTVEQGDLDLVLLNWGEAAAPLPGGWFQDLPDGTIDQNELDGVLLNWGNTAGAGSPTASATVPEPAAWLLAVGVMLAFAGARFWRQPCTSSSGQPQ